jgi:hypothetical protein
MKTEFTQINLLLAWLWILLGFISGMLLGLFFHRENWLGGYGSLKRRMYRLGHISFFGLGVLNLMFYLTVQRFTQVGADIHLASLVFIIGAVAMPICCVVMAHFPKAHLIFAVPVVSLILGGTLTVAHQWEELKAPGTATSISAANNIQPSTPTLP